ncbi:MAG: hypothetical protein ABF859_06560 [Gluconobacter sp.]
MTAGGDGGDPFGMLCPNVTACVGVGRSELSVMGRGRVGGGGAGCVVSGDFRFQEGHVVIDGALFFLHMGLCCLKAAHFLFHL